MLLAFGTVAASAADRASRSARDPHARRGGARRPLRAQRRSSSRWHAACSGRSTAGRASGSRPGRRRRTSVAARLAGLSPNELSLANTLLASVAARHARDPRRLGGAARHDDAAVPRGARARRRAASRGSRRSGSPAPRGLGIGMLESLIELPSTKIVVPDRPTGVPLPGVKELLVFVLIVAAMFLRGASLPTRGELVEQRLPDVPRPEARLLLLAIPSTRPRARSRSSCCRSTSARR